MSKCNTLRLNINELCISTYLTVLMCNLCCGQEATVLSGHSMETMVSYRQKCQTRKGAFYLLNCLICMQNVSHEKLCYTQRKER